MKQDEWDAMTSKQQADFLRAGKIKIKTQTFIDKNGKPGHAKVVTGRRAFCRGVAITDWLTDDETTVRATAYEQIEALIDKV